jgi:hypothetical protein
MWDVDANGGRLLCRWVNCLLLREVPFLLSLRLWDTYLAEGPRMKDFLKYVLAAFLLYWSAQLSTMDFQVGGAPPPPPPPPPTPLLLDSASG